MRLSWLACFLQRYCVQNAKSPISTQACKREIATFFFPAWILRVSFLASDLKYLALRTMCFICRHIGGYCYKGQSLLCTWEAAARHDIITLLWSVRVLECHLLPLQGLQTSLRACHSRRNTFPPSHVSLCNYHIV